MILDATRNPPSQRDPRADFFRGVALWMIVVNHTPGNWLGNLTLKNFSFCDATEAFVLLAGYAGAFAYAGLADRSGWLVAASALIRRIGKLYVAHIFLLVVFTAQVGFSAAALDRATYLDELALDPFADQPYRTLLEALLLRFQPAFLDILPLYIVLLALFVPGLALRHRPWLLLALSIGLWVGVRAAGINLPRWQEGGWFFNPLAWQLLFVIGFFIGQAVRGAGAPGVPPKRAWITALAILLLGSGFVAMLAVEQVPFLGEHIPALILDFLATVDKTSLHPFRLASMLALTYLIAHYLPRDAGVLQARWAKPLLSMGRHSLPVFCVGILLSFLIRLMLEERDDWLMQLAANFASIGTLVVVARLAEWQRTGGNPRPNALPAETRAA